MKYIGHVKCDELSHEQLVAHLTSNGGCFLCGNSETVMMGVFTPGDSAFELARKIYQPEGKKRHIVYWLCAGCMSTGTQVEVAERVEDKIIMILLPRDGLSYEYVAYINSPQWAAFRDSIFNARGRKCERCGRSKGAIDVHHLTYRNFMHEGPEDVQVLCRKCHTTAHEKIHGRKFSA